MSIKKIYEGSNHQFTTKGNTSIIEINPGLEETLQLGGSVNIVDRYNNTAELLLNGSEYINPLNLGSMAYQNNDLVDINGGNIDGVYLYSSSITTTTVTNSTLTNCDISSSEISVSTFFGNNITTCTNTYINISTTTIIGSNIDMLNETLNYCGDIYISTLTTPTLSLYSAGTPAYQNIIGNDTAGIIGFRGDKIGDNRLCRVTFVRPYVNIPIVMLYALYDANPIISPFAENITTTSFDYNVSTATVSTNGLFSFSYICIGY